MHPTSRRSLLAPLALALAVALVGCGSPGGAGAGTSTGTTGGSRPGGSTSRIPAPPATSTERPPVTVTRPPPLRPPSVTRPGSASTQPPTSQLPPPQQSQDLARALERRFGIDIRGPGATPEHLGTLERALQDYRPDQLRGLQVVNFPLIQGSQGLLGLWQSDGRRSEISLYVQTRRAPQLGLHTVSHELGHQISMMTEQSWGDALERALGQSSSSFPSPYSRSSPPEMLAENIAFGLLGGESEERALPGWRPNAQAVELLRQQYGARLKI